MAAGRRIGAARVLLAGALLLVAGAAASAGETAAAMAERAAATSEPARTAARLDPVRVGAAVDGAMAAAFEAHALAGAVVAVVDRDGTLYQQGYGFADLAARVPADPERTLFRVGSISKLLVWLAAMQAIEAGRLGVDADVNTVLHSLQVPAHPGGPVTMRHLMSHSAGFDERVIGLFSTRADAAPLAAQLAAELPARVRAPGDAVSYSNHGTDLAALVVSDLAGVDWHELVRRDILDPLAMHHTSTVEPPVTAEPTTMAEGYVPERGVLAPFGFEYLPIDPAGSVSATAADMARFMRMWLRDGELDGVRVLDAATARHMREPLQRAHPALPGMLHGFYETDIGGIRGYGHGGDTIAFHSKLLLLPEQGIGVFVSFNSLMGGVATEPVVAAIVRALFAPPRAPRPEPVAAAALAPYAGEYQTLRRSSRDPSSLVALLTAIPVAVDPDGWLVLPRADGLLERFGRVGDDLFRAVDGDRQVAFTRAADGTVRRLHLADAPPMTFERAGAWRSTGMAGAVLAIGLGFALVAAVRWPWQWLRGARMPGPRAAALIGGLAAVLLLATAVGAVAMLQSPRVLVFGVGTAERLLFWLPVLAMPLVLLQLAYLVPVLREGRGRLLYTGSALSAAVLLAWMWTWQLFAFGLR